MTCGVCQDQGVIRVGYDDGQPHDYGVCLCPVGQQLRVTENAGRTVDPQWVLWAARRGISTERVDADATVSRIGLVEDLFDAGELAAMPFPASCEPASSAALTPLESQLIAAGKTRRAKL